MLAPDRALTVVWRTGSRMNRIMAMVVMIYGAGSVGLGLASCLLKARAELDLIDNEGIAASLREHGLQRTGIFGDIHAYPSEFQSCSSLSCLSHRQYDYILVCTKSFDSHEAAKDLADHKHLIGANTRIVICQNGWGNAEVFTALFRREQVYNARIITGFQRLNNHTVVVTVHADAIRVGNLFGFGSSCVKQLCKSITEGGIPCEVTDEIGKYLWDKMLYNCALNPLGALLDVTYGALAESQSTRHIMDHIVREVFSVMTAAGYETHFQTPEAFLEVFYDKLVPDTAEHRSSTLQDIKAGRRTEIEALNGAVIELAKTHGIDAPYNSVLFHLVKSLEARNL